MVTQWLLTFVVFKVVANNSAKKPTKRFLVDTDKMILKCICKSEGTIIAKTILKMKNKVVEISLPNVNTYSTVTIIRTEWY